MKLKMSAIKKEARAKASELGHKLGRFMTLSNGGFVASCTQCHFYLMIKENPRPHEERITGRAANLPCRKRN